MGFMEEPSMSRGRELTAGNAQSFSYHDIALKNESAMREQPAPIVCDIAPRTTCHADELKALAVAIKTWHDALSGWEWSCGIHFQLHKIDLRDLRRGELPLPAGLKVASDLRRAQELLGTTFSLPTTAEATKALGTRRSVSLLGQPTAYYSEDALFSPACVISSQPSLSPMSA